MPTISPQQLTKLSEAIFQAAGVPANESEIVSKSLVLSNLCGHDSHGVIRIPQYVGFLESGKLVSPVDLTVFQETPAMVAADGNWGIGQVQTYRLLDQLLPKCQALGIASGTLRRTGHIGRLGEYAEWAARNECVLFCTVNSHGSGRRVAPPGGTEGRISTNPICFGVPTAKDPVVLDFSTSVCAEGKVRVASQKGEQIPEGWVLDASGNPTTDPNALYADPPGSILPFGGNQGYKGFGLGLVMDLLAGSLSGGECSRPDRPMPGLGNSAVFVLFSIKHFGGSEHFLSTATNLTEFVRSSARREGVSQITLPGDPERTVRASRESTGIDIPDGTWKLIAETATKRNVSVEEFLV
ncbi:MAG: Ldh family oxidoreductase [Zavarzinella sp.]